MGLTKKDVDFQIRTAKVIANVGLGQGAMDKFDLSKLKYRVNSKGQPVLYLEKFEDQSDLMPTDFTSIVDTWEEEAKDIAEEEAQKVAAETKAQVLSDRNKEWRDFVKSILKRADVAKKEFEDMLEQKNIDTKKSNWYKTDDYSGLFEE